MNNLNQDANPPEDPAEIESYVADVLEDFRDGVLGDAALEEFRALLKVNPLARRAFLEHNLMDHMISSASLFEKTGKPGVKSVLDESSPAGVAGNKFAMGKLKFWLPLAIAASLLILLSTAGLFRSDQNKSQQALRNGRPKGASSKNIDQIALRPESAESPVAVLVGAEDAKWNTKGMSSVVGMPLRTGWLDLVSGMASIRFNSGAVARLVGPARFQLIDGQQGYLAGGSVIANVPPAARGFQIHTAAMQLTDLGTEFAVRVGDSDSAEVHVIDGQVEVECETSLASKQTFSMRTDEAKRFVARTDPATLEVDNHFAEHIVPRRQGQRIGYYTFTSEEKSSGRWTTNPSARLVGGDDVRFHDFSFQGVVPAPFEFERNLNRWSFKNWQPKFRSKKFYVGFKVTAPAGKSIQLNGLSLELFRAGGNKQAELAPQDGVVRISSDGFETFQRFVLLDQDTFVLEPKFVSANLKEVKIGDEFEFRFLFRGQSKARAIRLDEVTLDLDVVSPK